MMDASHPSSPSPPPPSGPRVRDDRGRWAGLAETLHGDDADEKNLEREQGDIDAVMEHDRGIPSRYLNGITFLLIGVFVGIPLAVGPVVWLNAPKWWPITFLISAGGTIRWWYHQRMRTMNAADAASLHKSRGRCATCAYSLRGLPREPDGCTVCPECGAAWRLAASK